MLKTPFTKILALYLIAALFALTFPAQGWAMLVPAASAKTRTADAEKIRITLESSLIQQRLLDYGLTPEETARRLNTLSNEQVHRLAANLDAVQAGGDVLSDVIVILLLVVIVIAVLELTGHHVVVRR
jgi:hypothetical protein